MRIGGHFGAPGPLMAPFDVADRYGATCFQMFIGESHIYWPFNYGDADCEAFKLRKTKSNMIVAVHGNYIVNIAYDGLEKNKFNAGIKSILSQLKVCDRIGADFLVMHVGSCKEEGRLKGVDNLIRACTEILNSNPNTTLLLENSAGGGTQIGHVDLLADAVRRVNSHKLALCFDTTHGYADGLDLENKNWRGAFWGEYGGLIKWLHFNMPDPKVQPNSHLDRHQVPWNKGRWDQQVMLDIASEWGPNVPLCMEAGPDAYPINFMILEENGF